MRADLIEQTSLSSCELLNGIQRTPLNHEQICICCNVTFHYLLKALLVTTVASSLRCYWLAEVLPRLRRPVTSSQPSSSLLQSSPPAALGVEICASLSS